MNTTFSLKRFWQLIRLHGAGSWKSYTIAYGILIILMVYLSMVGGYKMILAFYSFALCIAGTLISARIFRSWSDFGNSSSTLMLPASLAEKFSIGIIYGLVLFVPLFTCIYYFSAWITLNIFDHAISMKEIWRGPESLHESAYAFFMPTMMLFLLVQPIALYSAVRFRKYQFQIMILLIISLFVGYYYAQHLLMLNLTKTLAFNYIYFIVGDHLTYFSAKNGGNYVTIMVPAIIQKLNIAMWMIFAAGMYVVAFLRLKEREI